MENKTIILTHRGLEPSKKDFYPESSYQAFEDHLKRGFGIEFDPNFIKDNIIVSHDMNLSRITNKNDSRTFSDLTTEEIKSLICGNQLKGRISFLSEILTLITNSKAEVNAMHLKGIFQTNDKIDILLEELKKYPEALNKIIIFDIKPETARYIKSKLPELKLAPSVAHEYDIKRYNQAVKGTLISVEDAIKYKQEGLYDWVWLDEWDLSDENNNSKKLYTLEIFSLLKNKGYKISLVTPELHGTSPGLLGGEAHPGAKNKETLFARIKDIFELSPDAICTDYPEECLNMMV